MPKIFSSKHQKIGELGEEMVARFLIKQKFSIIDRNYTRQFGEIDIICKKDSVIHFVEVKSVSYETNISVPRETYIRPEENMTKSKFDKLHKTAMDYLSRHNLNREEWQIDLYCVFIDFTLKQSKIVKFEHVVL